MLEERVFLKGNKKERICQALGKAGWFPERKAEITSVLDYYNKWSIPIGSQVIEFFQEYYGIASKWYIEVQNLDWAADFEFQLFPYPEKIKVDVIDFMYEDSEYRLESEEYQSVKAYSGETVVMVGEIGYYYPAHVWIGCSGALYCTYEYDDEVRKFDSIMSLLEYELLGRSLDSIAMKA